MTQRLEIDAPRPLTEFERRQVQTYAAFLVAQADSPSPDNTVPKSREPRRISFEGWAGCLAGIEPEKSNKEFVRDAWEDLVKKWEK